MKDPYALLGVDRKASAEDIKKAYRRLARTLHPDVNTKDPRAEDRFKEVNAAHDLLSDPEKRARYDRGEIDANGQERGFSGFGGGARRASGGFSQGFGTSGWSSADDSGVHFRFDDLFKGAQSFEDIFARAQAAKQGRGTGSAGAGAGRRAPPTHGADVQYRLRVSFEDAALGTTQRISLTNGRTVNVRIPEGTESGTVLRLRGQGKPGSHGGEAGDALVEIVVREHPVFRRDGEDVIAEIPISLTEAVLGGKITVPTIDGRVTVTIPEGSNTGATLRLKGKGLPIKDGPKGVRGDQFVKLRVVLEDPTDEKLRTFLRSWRPAKGHDVRADMEDPAASAS